ncbi:MFS transporter [Streptomyces sp. AN091965]|uniref:MFS transporter n=1 Tax=Streptomyces sp. AN091965 TaxID=2927803 RepID=UPI001F61E4AE|nr:MFS transporter [Streptomyces sp. AN091965]MCI3929347.1 MFS transporter [Streptomyces sp. AN091965]
MSGPSKSATSATPAAPVAPTTPAPPPDRVSVKTWLAVVAMALGTFAMITVEALPVGLMTSISGGLDVSEGAVGLLVTVPGLVAAVTAPVLPVLIGRLDRRLVLLALLTLMVAANALSAAASGFALLLVARFVAGVSIGGFWALAAGIAVRLVPERHIPRATALVFGGATAANVIGVPAATFVGELSDWRVAFLAVAGLGLLVVAGLVFLLPSLPATEPVRLSELPRQFRNRTVRAGVIATGLLVGGHYAAFTFISPILQETSGVSESLIGPLLLVYGLAGIGGTVLAGITATRDVRATIIAMSVLLAAVLALFPLVGRSPATGIVLLVLWGLAFGGIPVAVQTWVLKAAPGSTEAATALNTSMFNLAIASGAALGGVVVSAVSLTAVLGFGAALSALTSLAVWRTRKI